MNDTTARQITRRALRTALLLAPLIVALGLAGCAKKEPPRPPLAAGELRLVGECPPAAPLSDRLLASAADLDAYVAAPSRGIAECAGAFIEELDALDFSAEKVLVSTSDLRSFTVDGGRLVAVVAAPCEATTKGSAESAPPAADEPPRLRFYRLGLATTPSGVFKLGSAECTATTEE